MKCYTGLIGKGKSGALFEYRRGTGSKKQKLPVLFVYLIWSL